MNNEAQVPMVIGTHPDLFGPDTPLIVSVPIHDAVKVWEIDLKYRHRVTVRIVATSDSEARALALEKANSGDFDGDGRWEYDCSSQEEPTEAEISEYVKQFKRGEH